jgi:hypothetical protein
VKTPIKRGEKTVNYWISIYYIYLNLNSIIMNLNSVTLRGLLSLCNCFLFIFCLVYALLFAGSVAAQQELQIHHINIENGDATMIAVYDNATQQYRSKILIDGGQSSASQFLLPYIKKITGGSADGMHFNYVILTHYHNDHYTGLLALGTGDITADSLVDPAGYSFTTFFPNQPHLANISEPVPTSLVIAPQWTSLITQATIHHFLQGRSEILTSFGTTGQSSLGHKLIIGNMNGLPITLECVAGWGNTLSGNGTVPDPQPSKNNANNFSLAFILRCGEFRYFIGGDLGGSDQGLYIDQEDSLIPYFSKDLSPVHSISGQQFPGGHVCGAKADHHGSSYANTDAFMNSMHPAITVTSAGNNVSWHLPQVGFIDKVAAIQPISPNNGSGVYSRGVYFTNLYDWGSGKQSLTEATTLLNNKPGISFDYGNPTGHKYSYMVRIKPDHLANESDFEVDRVDITQSAVYTLLETFLCHKK